MKILIIIPAYNEQENILNVIDSLKKCTIKLDYIVINDCSKDNTETILNENNINHIKLIHNLGIGGAVQTGYKYAYENNYDIAIQFDGDGQHDCGSIPKLIDPILKNEADFVIGSRFIENNDTFKSTSTRRAGIKIISFFIKLLSGVKITDPTSGFRAANKKVIEMFAKNYPVEYPEPESTIYLIKRKNKVKEVSVNMNERTGGVSSIRAWKSIYYMFSVCLAIIIESLKGVEK